MRGIATAATTATETREEKNHQQKQSPMPLNLIEIENKLKTQRRYTVQTHTLSCVRESSSLIIVVFIWVRHSEMKCIHMCLCAENSLSVAIRIWAHCCFAPHSVVKQRRRTASKCDEKRCPSNTRVSCVCICVRAGNGMYVLACVCMYVGCKRVISNDIHPLKEK